MCVAASLQWEKIRKSGKLPHLSRWYEFLAQTSPLKEVAEAHAPKKSAAAERVAAAKDTFSKGSAKAAAGTCLIVHVGFHQLSKRLEAVQAASKQPQVCLIVHWGFSQAAWRSFSSQGNTTAPKTFSQSACSFVTNYRGCKQYRQRHGSCRLSYCACNFPQATDQASSHASGIIAAAGLIHLAWWFLKTRAISFQQSI